MKLEIKKLKIGGLDQWISLLGNAENEIILILHGGPGLAGMPLYNKFLEPLSKNLMIVNWDQRGAGKSYNIRIPKKTMNLNQFVADAIELINFLRNKFKKDKIFLLGHSWGSALGVLVCQKCPELIHKYFGVGQIGDWSKGELISYNFIQTHAKRLEDRRAQKTILKIGKPPHSLRKLILQRNLLMKFGGAMYKERNYFRFIKISLRSDEYNFIDIIRYILGLRFSLNSLWMELNKLNLLKEVPEIKIPICFLIGSNDYQVPFECSEEYYNIIKVPNKSWYWFEKSGHNLMFEEPNKFLTILKKETKT